MAPKRILIIDDEQPFSEMLKLNLEQVGKYVALEENDARRALATDAELRDVPIIFLTALVSREEVPSGGMTNRAHRMLPKSTPIESLIKIIEMELAGVVR
jgi:CheY-like chemotaxis protein